MVLRKKILTCLCVAVVSIAAMGADGQFIIGDGSGGGGGGANFSTGGSGGAGGGSSGVVTGTAGNDVIFGDGSGGGGGGRPVGTGDGPGGAGGGGSDSINGGAGNDIIFGDGFNGANAGYNAGPGGLGGGGGGGAGGTFGSSPPAGGPGGLGGGSGGGGTINGPGGVVLLNGFGNGGGGNGGGGGSSATSAGAVTGSGGSGSGAGGGGGAFGGAAGGSSTFNARNGAAGGTSTHVYADTGGSIYTYLSTRLGNVFTSQAGTVSGFGAGQDTINGGPGSDDLFGLGGNDHFVFDINDAAGDTDTIWDFRANGDTDFISLLNFTGDLLGNGNINTILAAQTANGNDRTIVYTISGNTVTIVVKNIGRNLVLTDFNLAQPTGANGTTAASEDTAFTYAVSDFTYSDTDANPFGGVQVVTTATGLTLNNVAITNGTIVKAVDIAAGRFKYTAPADQSGNGLGNFSFKVFDGSVLSAATYSQTVNVAAVNDPPTAPTDSDAAANTVAENSANGTTVGVTAASTDPDAGAVLTFSLTNSAGGRFAINANSGVVTVADGSLLNFEAATSHMITVQVSDGTATASQNFTIAVTNVNEAPTALVDANAAANAVMERAANGSLVGVTASATDPDAGAVLTYSLTDDAGGRFAINATTGGVSVANGTLLVGPVATYNISVRVSDGAFNNSATFTITLGNVNDAPVIGSFTATPLTAATGETVTFTVAASDPDGTTPTVTFDYGDGSTGSSLTHAYASVGTYTATVTVSDGELSDAESVTITVVAADFNNDGFIGPMDKDSDGDGVPDAMETLLGTNPNDANDSPIDQTQAIPFRMEKQKALFSSDLGDKVEFRGVLHVRAGLDPAGEILAIDAGGNLRKVELDAKGRFQDADVDFQLRAKMNERKAKEAKFRLKITGALLAKLVANAPKDEQGRPTQLTAHILFDGVLLIQTKQLTYRK